MQHSIKAILFVILLIICLLEIAVPAQRPEVLDLPLSKGSYWVYQGTIKARETQANCDSTEPVEQVLTFKMEVVEIIDRGRIIAAVLKGYLRDLMDFEVLKSGTIKIIRTDYLFIRVGKGKYYVLDGDEMAETLKRLWDPTDLLDGLVKEDDLEFDFPLSRGKAFGNPELISRQKREIESGDLESIGWLNVVTDERQIKLKGVQGINPSETVTQYQLRHLTNSSLRETEVIPGTGITKFDFSYHPAGCLIVETNVKLIEYHKGN